MSKILITGGTGFLGSALIDEILNSGKSNVIYALTRRSENFKDSRIKTCRGDITKKNLGLDKTVAADLMKEIDVIYHCAALTDFNRPMKDLKDINVEGTRNVLDFALLCRKEGSLKKINHISTAYVAGTMGSKRCRIMENDLDLGQKFNNGYEQTKFEAEKCVGEYRQKGLDVDIFRPGIILGRYNDGKTTNFKMLYQPIHFFSLEFFDKIPAPAYNVGNLINLDIAAAAILLISGRANAKNMNYHIASPKTVSLAYVLDIAAAYFGFKKPEFVPPSVFDITKEYTPVKRKMIEPYAAYFNYGANFDMTNTMSQLGPSGFIFPEFDEKNFMRLFEYCAKTGFIKRKKHVTCG